MLSFIPPTQRYAPRGQGCTLFCTHPWHSNISCPNRETPKTHLLVYCLCYLKQEGNSIFVMSSRKGPDSPEMGSWTELWFGLCFSGSSLSEMPVGTVMSNYWETGLPGWASGRAGVETQDRTWLSLTFFFPIQAGCLQPWDLELGLTLLQGFLPHQRFGSL